jgi:hypothetical protein
VVALRRESDQETFSFYRFFRVHVILSKQTETLTFSKAGYRSASRLPLVSTRCQWRLLASVRRPPFQRHCKPTHVYTARKKDIGLALKEKKAQGPAEIAKQHCGEAAFGLAKVWT